MKSTYVMTAVMVVGMGWLWTLGRDDQSSGKFVGEFSQTLAKISDDIPVMPELDARRTVSFDQDEMAKLEDLIADCCVRRQPSSTESHRIRASIEPDCGGWNE